MSQNVPIWKWTEERERTAVLLAEDHLTDEKIADVCGINRRQLTRWKQHPAFAARVKEIAEEFGNALQRYAIARKLRRVGWLDRRRHRRSPKGAC